MSFNKCHRDVDRMMPNHDDFRMQATSSSRLMEEPSRHQMYIEFLNSQNSSLQMVKPKYYVENTVPQEVYDRESNISALPQGSSFSTALNPTQLKLDQFNKQNEYLLSAGHSNREIHYRSSQIVLRKNEAGGSLDKVERSFRNPDMSFRNPDMSFRSPEMSHRMHERSYRSSERSYRSPERSYRSPERSYRSPERSYRSPERSYRSPERSYRSPERSYGNPQVNYKSPERRFTSPEITLVQSPEVEVRNPGIIYNNEESFVRRRVSSFDSTEAADLQPIEYLSVPEVGGELDNQVKKRKRSKYSDKSEKICAVCGDVAKSMHFGGMACDSCKAFFRRSVQSNSFGSFICNSQKNCPVIKDNRRICQYCRFEKCKSSGMEVRWVMSEADRMSLWKSKLSKHRKNAKSGKSSQGKGEASRMYGEPASLSRPSTSSMVSMTSEQMRKPHVNELRAEDREAIEYLVTLQDLVFKSMPYPAACDGDSTASMANLFYCICQRLRAFFYRLEDFWEIPQNEQTLVLRNGIAMSIYLHGAYNYDTERRIWPDLNINQSLRIPNVSRDTLKLFTVLPEMFDTLMIFYDTYGECIKDEAILVLLCLITLFYDNDACSSSRAFIQNVNNRYIYLLRSYLISIEGEQEGNIKLTKLLHGIFSIKKIVAFHQVVDIRHSVEAVYLIHTNHDPLKKQMIAVSFLLTNAIQGNGPTHSSILSAQEEVDLQLKQSRSELAFRRPEYLPDPQADFLYFHPITNAIFENYNSKKLLSCEFKNILGMKPNLTKLLALKHKQRNLPISFGQDPSEGDEFQSSKQQTLLHRNRIYHALASN